MILIYKAFVFAPLILAASSVNARDLDVSAIQIIHGAAVLLCGDYRRNGEASISESDIRGSLQEMKAALISSGTTNVRRSDSNYVGLLREQLGEEFSDVRACRLKIWNDLKNSVISGYQASTGDVEASTTVYYRHAEAPWMVSFGTFKNLSGALRRRDQIAALGLLPTVIRTDDYPGLSSGYYKVIIPAHSRENADALAQIARAQVPDAYVETPWN